LDTNGSVKPDDDIAVYHGADPGHHLKIFLFRDLEIRTPSEEHYSIILE